MSERNNPPLLMRIEIAVYDVKVLEAVVPAGMQDSLWHWWCEYRHAQGLPLGGAVMHRADLPRTWPQNVGASIPLLSPDRQWWTPTLFKEEKV